MIEISLDSNVYSLEAVKKCSYWYTDNYSVDIKQDDDQVILLLEPLNEDTEEDKDQIIKKLKNDLLDFQVRDIVTKETKNVRDLLIAKAFATTDKYETNPPGEVSDPVGFKP